MVGRLDSVICLGEAVTSYQIPEAGPRADVAYNFVNIPVVSPVVDTVGAIFGVYLCVLFLFHMAFGFVAMGL